MKGFSDKNDPWNKLMMGLDSGTRFRVTKTMILNSDKAFTKYALVKATGIKTRMVEDQLKNLLEIGWIKCFNITPKTYQINMQNKTIRVLHSLFSEIKLLHKKSL